MNKILGKSFFLSILIGLAGVCNGHTQIKDCLQAPTPDDCANPSKFLPTDAQNQECTDNQGNGVTAKCEWGENCETGQWLCGWGCSNDRPPDPNPCSNSTNSSRKSSTIRFK